MENRIDFVLANGSLDRRVVLQPAAHDGSSVDIATADQFALRIPIAHQGHYQGEIAVRMALGDDVTPDYRALPRATYTDPELASVGLTLEGAKERGLDAFEQVADFPTTAKGYSVEAAFGHVTIVVDRDAHELVGAAMATPDASAGIHECVLAIKARVPIEVLADTIHAFPSTSRVFNGLFNAAAKKLADEEMSDPRDAGHMPMPQASSA